MFKLCHFDLFCKTLKSLSEIIKIILVFLCTGQIKVNKTVIVGVEKQRLRSWLNSPLDLKTLDLITTLLGKEMRKWQKFWLLFIWELYIAFFPHYYFLKNTATKMAFSQSVSQNNDSYIVNSTFLFWFSAFVYMYD